MTNTSGELQDSPLDLKIMQTVEIEFDERTLTAVDAVVENLQTSRANFIKKAVENALRENWRNRSDEDVAKMYAEAYEKNPVQPDEFDVDEEQLIESWKDL